MTQGDLCYLGVFLQVRSSFAGQVQSSGTLVKDLKEQISKVRGIPLPLGSERTAQRLIFKRSVSAWIGGRKKRHTPVSKCTFAMVSPRFSPQKANPLDQLDTN